MFIYSAAYAYFYSPNYSTISLLPPAAPRPIDRVRYDSTPDAPPPSRPFAACRRNNRLPSHPDLSP